MDRETRKLYLKAAKTPDEPIISAGDAMKVLGITSYTTMQRFSKEGLIKIRRTCRNYRIYSYNEVEKLKKLNKLFDLNVPLRTIKVLMEYAESKGENPLDFIEDFTNFFIKRIYSENRRKARETRRKKEAAKYDYFSYLK